MAVDADLSIGPPGAPEVHAEPGDGPELDDLALDDAPHVDESVVRTLLRSLGGGVGHVFGDPDVADHWRFTNQELDELTPPLTRIINRRPKLRRAVARGDEMAVAMVLAGYTGRNVASGRRAKEARGAVDGEAGAAAGSDRAAAEGLVGRAGRDGGHGGGPSGTGGGGVG